MHMNDCTWRNDSPCYGMGCKFAVSTGNGNWYCDFASQNKPPSDSKPISPEDLNDIARILQIPVSDLDEFVF